MTVEDFIARIVPLSSSICYPVSSIDVKTATLAIQIIDQLLVLKKGVFWSLIGQNLTLREDYISLLENINAIALASLNSGISDWIAKQLTDLMDKLCTL